jgi:hypothetical protein
MKTFLIGTLWFSSHLLKVQAETVRGVHRELAVPDAVNLLSAADYAILSKSGISTVPGSTITGNIAVSPAAATYMTGFSLTADSTNVFSTSTQVVGEVYAANYHTPTPALLTSAVSDMEAAYTDAAGRVNTNAARINIGTGLLGGSATDDVGGSQNPLTTGIYTFSTSVSNAKGDIHFTGSATDIFIIQMAGDLSLNAASRVILTADVVNGSVPLAKNIFWQVAGSVNLGAEAHMEGIILAKKHVVFETESSLNGRVLTQTACTLAKATVNQRPE